MAQPNKAQDDLRPECTGDDATGIERRHPSLRRPPIFPAWLRSILRTGWVILAVLFLIVLAGADLAEWLFSPDIQGG